MSVRYILGLFLLLATASSQAADIDWNGWSFDYSTNNNSSGLVLSDVSYNNKKILAKVSMPVMRVQYENDICGPYADILYIGALSNPNNGAQIAACNNQAVCQRTFTQNGEEMLEIGANWQIGEYQIYQTYYFSENGYFDSRVYSRGLQCQLRHSHHGHWMFDFDIDGSDNDQIARGENDVQTTEFNDLKTNTPFWTIQDKVTGSKVRLTPAADDGVPGNFAKWDLAGRAFVDREVGRWRNGARGEIGNLFNTPAQNIDGTDVVLWYVTHLPHTPEEGASIWHASGPRLEVLDATPDPAPTPDPDPTPTPDPQNPEPVIAGNVLNNGGFETDRTGWGNCGPAANVAAVTSDQAAGNGAVYLAGGGCIYQEAAAVADNEFTLTCSANRSGNGWTIVEMSYLDANYANLSTEVKQVTHTGSYIDYSVSGVAPAGTAFVAALLYSEADTYFDSCNLVPGTVPDPPPVNPPPVNPPVTSVISNGSFENNLTGWNSCSNSSLLTISNDSDDGSSALQVVNGGCLYQEFPVEPGKTYSMNCRAKSEGTVRYTSISLSMMNMAYTSLANEELPVSTTAYGNYTTQLLAPAGSKYGAVVAYSEDIGLFDSCSIAVN